MTIQNKKNTKFIIFFLPLIILFLILVFNTDKLNFCITLIKYDIGDKKFTELNINAKKKMMSKIDSRNNRINNYYRFTHNVIATSSTKGLCKQNTKLIIDNLNIYKESKIIIPISKIYKFKEINVKGIFIFLFIIFTFSFIKFIYYLITFSRNQIISYINQNKN